MDVQSRNSNCGHKEKEISIQEIVEMPLSKRGTNRSTAKAVNILESPLLKS